MATTRARKLWTTFVTVMMRLLASLGLAERPSTPAAQARVGTAAEPTPTLTDATAVPAAVPELPRRPVVPVARRMRDVSAPPTLKQRIVAEAHGSNPASRLRSSLLSNTRMSHTGLCTVVPEPRSGHALSAPGSADAGATTA